MKQKAKIHLIKSFYPKAQMPSHFKTLCGIKKHIMSNIETTLSKKEITCKSCLKQWAIEQDSK